MEQQMPSRTFRLVATALVVVNTASALVVPQTPRHAILSGGRSSSSSWRSSRRPSPILLQSTASDELVSGQAENLDGPIIPSSSASTEGDMGSELFLTSLENNLVVTQEVLLGDLGEGAVARGGVEETALRVPPPALFAEDDTINLVLAASSEAVVRAEETLSQQTLSVTLNGVNSTLTDGLPVSSSMTTTPEGIPDILPASDVIGETTTEKIPAPSVGKILKFAVPAIGVWLCGPLLSLIDTSSVGMLSGTVQQAALNPAVAVTDYGALLVAFLFTATTNLIAAARESDRGADGQMPVTTKTFIGALQMSTFVGVGLGAVLFLFAKQLLKAIIGNDGISPVVFAASMKYVKIRALGMPAAAVIGSAQAACLGLQDIRSPLYVLAVAAIVNFAGDMLFVGSTHPLIGGAAGAAWATVFSQYAAVAGFVYWLTHKPRESSKARVMDVSKAILELTGKPTSAGRSRQKKFADSIRSLRFSEAKKRKVRGGAQASVEEAEPKKESKPVEKSFSVRGFLKGGFRGRDLVKFPSREIVKEFTPYVLPVTSTQVGRVSGYVSMSHVVSSSLGMASMAAQQVIVSMFYCLTPVADSLSLTGQSFVPSIAGKKASKERANALRKTSINFAKAGGIFGALMVSAVGVMPFMLRFFTADPQVAALVKTVAPQLMGFFAVHGVLCAAEGILLGQKDLSFLGRVYAAYFAIVPYFMLRVKRAALAGTHSVGLQTVWTVFFGYQISRVAAWVLRVIMLQRRTDKEADCLP
jgi:Na+-driven multidrug efflux pump